jgi:hypothetical protein
MSRRIVLVVALIGALVLLFIFRNAKPPHPEAKRTPRAELDTDTSTDADSEVETSTRSRAIGRRAGTSTKTHSVAAGEVVIGAKWGSRLGELGRRRDPEANPEAPMAILPDGRDLLVLDQVNARVQRFRDGAAISAFGTSDTAQDLAIGPGGKTVTLDRLVDKAVHVYDPAGQQTNTVPIAGPGLTDSGVATGVVADEEGIWVEREHGSLVNVADREGEASKDRRERPGRPTKDGRAFVAAAVTDKAAGRIVVTAFDRATLEVRWSQELALGASILQILMVDSDPQGNVYVAAAIAHEGPPPDFRLEGSMIRVIRLSPGGQVTGQIDLPPLESGDEMLRPMTVGDDGSIYLMSPNDSGMNVLRYRF